MINKPLSERYSKLVTLLGGVCVLHCLATPFVIILLPSLSQFFTETAEMIIVLSVVPIGVAGFYPTWIKHKNSKVHIGFILGMLALLVSQFLLHIDHNLVNGEMELSSMFMVGSKMGLSMLGAIFMAWSMYKNHSHSHSCKVPGHVH